MNELQIEREILVNARPEAVFDALTTSERIVEYFPLEKVTSSWTVGSELRMQGTRVTLVQSNLPSLDYCALMNEVWGSLLQSLQAYVESRDPIAGEP